MDGEEEKYHIDTEVKAKARFILHMQHISRTNAITEQGLIAAAAPGDNKHMGDWEVGLTITQK